MRDVIKIHQKVNTKILIVMLILVIVTAAAITIINDHNLHRIYEKTFTHRTLISSKLIVTLLDGEGIKYYVELLTNNGDDFKKKQIEFFNNREELFRLQELGAPAEEKLILLNRMKSFHYEMRELKTDLYWDIIRDLRELRDLSGSKYVYVFADTGVMSDTGEKLFTYIFDADDDDLYDEPDNDGLGTVNTGEAEIEEIYRTKKPMETVLYEKSSYGELFFTYAPVIDNYGNVVAILGTDVDLSEMRREIARSNLMFNSVFFASGIIIIMAIYFFVRRYVTMPLRELTATAQKLADGDVYANAPNAVLDQKSEFSILAHAFNDMSGVYQSMIKNTEELFSATTIGKLEVRNDESKYKGDIQKVIKQINDTLDAMTLYLNGVPAGIFIMSLNYEMYFRNSQFIRFFGDMPAHDFMSRMFTTDAQFTELLNQPDNDTAILINDHWFSVSFKEIVLSDVYQNSVLVIAVDITDLMNEKENAQAAAKAKSDFLSRMSHEMRTPMNAIIGMTKIADNTDDVSKLRYCLHNIGTSSKLLLGIINDVLDISKIEADKLSLETVPFNVLKMLGEINNLVNDNMRKKEQHFELFISKDVTMDYLGDVLRLTQVITNLLSNAVKFTPKDGRITLRVEETEQQGDISVLHFSVSDTGIGMTKEQIGRMFTSFEQADGSITRRFGGTGLGLAISKSIVEKMGGIIWAESEYGKGSTFNFNVKLERITPPAPSIQPVYQSNVAADTNGIPDFSEVHLLLAEDVEINQEIFIALLEATRISIDTAENGLAAVSKYKENPDKYDIIVMDIQMPEMDGYEATRTIRAFESEQHKNEIPIIALTANAFKEDIDRCIESGMNDHLAKPIDETIVIEKIRRYTKPQA